MKNAINQPAYRRVVARLNDCEERYAVVIKSLNQTDDAKLAEAAASLQDEITERRRLEIELLGAVEAERQRIGQDLHDDLCQHLSATALLAGTLAKEISKKDKDMGGKVSRIPALISEAIRNCRDLARGLAPVTLERDGLPAALQELAAKVPHEVSFEWPHSKRIDFESPLALHLYRIAEEALGNAVKHADAKHITIGIKVGNTHSALVITDNGKGLPTKVKSKGMGIRNMRYRANVIKGELLVKGTRGKGTIVTCSFPFDPGANGVTAEVK